MSSTWVTCFLSKTWPRPEFGWGRTSGVRRVCSTNAGGALCKLTRRNWSPSVRSKLANLAWQRRVAFTRMVSNTGCSSPGDLLMTCNTSDDAACWSSASASLFSRSARVSRVRPAGVLAFVPDERTRVGVRFSAPSLATSPHRPSPSQGVTPPPGVPSPPSRIASAYDGSPCTQPNPDSWIQRVVDDLQLLPDQARLRLVVHG